MKKKYQIVEKRDSKKLAEYLSKNHQLLMPMVELIEASQVAVDELVDVLGRASIEAVLQISGQKLAGAKQRGQKGSEIVWHGSQGGRVTLSDRKLKVSKPRLRRRCVGRGGEVEIPAYEAMNAGPWMGQRILDVLMRNVSTRNYGHVIPELAETVGVSKSSVSREFIEESEKELKRLCERRFDGLELLVIYLDGLVYGEHHVISAVGVDVSGKKHVLGMVEGASENAAAAVSLLEDLVGRGIDPGLRYLFVIDGSKALRKAIDQVFGSDQHVQRCRKHKLGNVCAKLPDELKDSVKALMRQAYKLPWKEGMAKLRKQAAWLQVEHPGAAASLLEGLEETFAINKIGLSPTLRRCLGTTNIIESPHAGVRMRTNRVSRWRNGSMVVRWVASAFLATEKNFRRIQGFRDLWMLKEILRGEKLDKESRAA